MRDCYTRYLYARNALIHTASIFVQWNYDRAIVLQYKPATKASGELPDKVVYYIKCL